jgi:hypothetical protein
VIKEILIDGDAVKVRCTVTGLGSGKELCKRDVKRTVKGKMKGEEIKLGKDMKDPGTVVEDGVDAGTTETGIGVEKLEKGAPEDWLLTTCSLATAALIAVFGVPDAAKVPDGSFMSAMYPNKPLARDPQRSDGNPGHFSLQESVGTVLAG